MAFSNQDKVFKPNQGGKRHDGTQYQRTTNSRVFKSNC